jgi:hypothetical protein
VARESPGEEGQAMTREKRRYENNKGWRATSRRVIPSAAIRENQNRQMSLSFGGVGFVDGGGKK